MSWLLHLVDLDQRAEYVSQSVLCRISLSRVAHLELVDTLVKIAHSINATDSENGVNFTFGATSYISQ